MNPREIKRTAIVFGLVLACAASLLNIQFFRASAQDITAVVGNIGPIIVSGTEKICDNTIPIANTDSAISSCTNLSTISLSAGSGKALSFFSKARDINTYDDIPTGPFAGVFYNDTSSDTGNASCTDDNNDCYQLSCSKVVNITSGGNTDAWIRCDFDLEYYADHSTGIPQWVGYIEVHDLSLVGANNGGAYTTEVEKLISGTFPLVDFGTVDAGITTDETNNIAIQHQNNGNVLLDYLVGLDNDDGNFSLDCQTGSLPTSNIRFDLTDVSFAGSSYNLAVEPSTVELDINILQRENDAAPLLDDDLGDIQRTYWNVYLPSAGVGGFCDEGLNVTVFEGP